MNKDFEKYLIIANRDLQYTNNHEELKSYVASILYDNDKKGKEIKRLSKLKINRDKELLKLNDEIERLNNIINELEKVLLEYKELCVNYEFDDVYTCEYNYYQQIAIADFIKSFVLNKLQELKGDSSNDR